ncbi:EAL domain-containing protein [Lysobacter olei]
MATSHPGPRHNGDSTAGIGADLAQPAHFLTVPTNLAELDALVVELAEAAFGCLNARLVWVSGHTRGGLPLRHQWPTTPLSQGETRLIDLARRQRSHAVDDMAVTGERRVAFPLGFAQAVFMADWPGTEGFPETFPPGFRAFLILLAARMRAEVELAAARRAAGRMEKAAKLQSAFYLIADLASSELDMPEMLRRIHTVVAGLMYAENFYISLYDPERDSVRFVYFADGADPRPIRADEEFPASAMGDSLTMAVIRSGRTAMGPSRQLREKMGLGGAGEHGPDSVDWLGVPMIAEGQVRGAVVVQSYDANNRYTQDDSALLAFVAQHILTALQRKQAHEELERRVEERTHALTEEVRERERGEQLQAALFRIADLASSELDMNEMLGRIHGVVGSLMYARNFLIALHDAQRDTLRFIYHADEKDPGLVDTDVEVPAEQMDNTITLGLIRHGKSVMGPPEQVSAQLGIPEGVFVGALAEDLLGVPMVAEGVVRGAILVQSYDPSVSFDRDDRALLAFVAQHILTALDRKQAQAELESRVERRTRELASVVGELREQIRERERVEQQLMHETLHDSLTGLPNRSFLYDALERAMARRSRNPNHSFAVLFLDLDRFKIINDSVGHHAGDEMLKQAGARLAACVRPSDVVARLGGDEFAMLLEEVNLPEEACHLAQRVIDALGKPMHIDGKELFTSASIGIALGNERYLRAEEMLRDADVAMYRAKAHGRQRFEIFDEQLHGEALQLLELESDLRRAVRRSEFIPYFQPIVRLKDRHVVGYEALLRWRHPRRGVLAPGEFLEAAEESGSVEQIDWQMFEKTCRMVRAQREDMGYVTINVSPRHFRSPALADQVLDMLDAHDLPHERIRLEVTEGALLDNPEQVQTTLEVLREAGVVAALDDFGTGYSSLSYLHRFPLHALKIDRSFVAALRRDEQAGSEAVVRAVLAMAGTLGMDVIAEGIETREQCDYLMEMGCQLGQGYLFSPARPASEWAAWRHH